MSCEQCEIPPGWGGTERTATNHYIAKAGDLGQVWLDGKDVTNRCAELYGSWRGMPGAVLLFDNPMQLCKCGNIAQHIAYGHVTFNRRIHATVPK